MASPQPQDWNFNIGGLGPDARPTWGCTCGTFGPNDPHCPVHRTACAPNHYVPFYPVQMSSVPLVPRLSDADVERVARRVVELLRETP